MSSLRIDSFGLSILPAKSTFLHFFFLIKFKIWPNLPTEMK